MCRWTPASTCEQCCIFLFFVRFAISSLFCEVWNILVSIKIFSAILDFIKSVNQAKIFSFEVCHYLGGVIIQKWLILKRVRHIQNWTKDGQNAALWSMDPKAKYTHMLLTDVAMHNNKTNDLLMLWMSWKSLFMRLWLSCILSCISQRHVLASEP